MTTFLHKIARETPMTQAPVATPAPVMTKEALVEIVLQVVANADWSQPGMDGRTGRTRSPRGEVLLATLTYCYAWGIYSSGNIEAAITGNRQNFDLLDRMPLDRKSFTQFRRYNRDLISVCLTQVLGRLGRANDAERRIARAVECDFLEAEE